MHISSPEAAGLHQVQPTLTVAQLQASCLMPWHTLAGNSLPSILTLNVIFNSSQAPTPMFNSRVTIDYW